MKKDRIWTLLSRKLSGEATKAELDELSNLLQAHPELDLPAELVKEYWELPAEADTDFLEATYHLHTQRLKQHGHDVETNNIDVPGQLNIDEDFLPAGKNKKLLVWGTAALAAVVLFMVFFYNPGSGAGTVTETAASEVSTKNGSRSKLTLPDGTQVWLNSNSKLVYDNENFGKTIREVTLTGEAYFDVVKNTASPFIIHTSKINIKVLGTAFNVKAYPEDRQTETSLIRGSVEVTIKNRPNDKIILAPDEKLIVDNTVSEGYKSKPVTVTKAGTDIALPQVAVNKLIYNPADSSIAETAWVNNRLVFRDESFEDVAVKMQRWYNVQIEIQDADLAKKRFSVPFENETVTQALDALKLSFPFKYRQEGTKIIIYR